LEIAFKAVSFNPLNYFMSRIVDRLIFYAILGIFVISCQSNTTKTKVDTAGTQLLAKEIVNTQPTQKAAKEHPGKAVYAKYCLVCHQANGSGVPGMYPPLSNGSWVGKDPKELVGILTKGLSGKVEVNNEVYKSAMPAQAQLTNEEIANVLSYVRSDFGNNFGSVDVEVVKKIRSAK